MHVFVHRNPSIFSILTDLGYKIDGDMRSLMFERHGLLISDVRRGTTSPINNRSEGMSSAYSTR